MAKAKTPLLTDFTVRTAQPQTKPYDLYDGGHSTVVLTVQPNGRKYFCVRYRFHGQQKRYALGDYPTLSLAKARALAAETRALIRHGGDPAGAVAAKKVAPTNTFTHLANAYLDWAENEKRRPNSAETLAEKRRLLKVEILPHWGDRDPADIKRHDVKTLLKPIRKRAPIACNATQMLISAIYNYGIREEWPGVEANPASLIEKQEVGSRDRVLSRVELWRLWRLLSNHPTTADRPAPGRKPVRYHGDDPLCPISEALADVYKVRLLTGQRLVELLRMRGADLDLDHPNLWWWNLPGKTTKNGVRHRIPLLPEARAILDKYLSGDSRALVFDGRNEGSLLHRSKKAPTAIRRALNIDSFKGTDLRRTMSTRMGDEGVSPELIARILNHIDGTPRATRVYNRSLYDKDKRAAFEMWTRVLVAIVEQEHHENVA